MLIRSKANEQRGKTQLQAPCNTSTCNQQQQTADQPNHITTNVLPLPSTNTKTLQLQALLARHTHLKVCHGLVMLRLGFAHCFLPTDIQGCFYSVEVYCSAPQETVASAYCTKPCHNTTSTSGKTTRSFATTAPHLFLFTVRQHSNTLWTNLPTPTTLPSTLVPPATSLQTFCRRSSPNVF